jgi:hypothetical protein
MLQKFAGSVTVPETTDSSPTKSMSGRFLRLLLDHHHCQLSSSLNKLAQAVMLLTFIRVVRGSNLVRDTDRPDVDFAVVLGLSG